MILLKTLGDFHDAAAICGIVGRIASGDNGTDDVEVGLIVEVTVMGETVDGVTNLNPYLEQRGIEVVETDLGDSGRDSRTCRGWHRCRSGRQSCTCR